MPFFFNARSWDVTFFFMHRSETNLQMNKSLGFIQLGYYKSKEEHNILLVSSAPGEARTKIQKRHFD
jgi:hypothetical protein